MPNLPIVIDGECDPNFEAVKRTFRDNFANKLESEGAAFAVYYDGVKVVDLWGGYADSSSKRKWSGDTMSVIFSTTKGVCAVCFSVIVDRGFAAYEDLVIKYWPEFGQNGKENITIEQLLSHQAGLAYVDGVIEEADVKDWKKMSEIFEKQTTNWIPGEKVAYHAITFGWIVDQLIRRIDPKHRSVSAFFREEIAIPHEIDLYIGAPTQLEYRIARLNDSTKISFMKEVMEYPVILKLIWKLMVTYKSRSSIFYKILQNTPWIEFNWANFNNPECRNMDIPSVNGVGTARALAKLFSLLTEGKLLKESTMEKLSNPVVVEKRDASLGFKVSIGKGFVFTKNIKGQWLFGHPGLGGQNVKVDLRNRVAFAYICNGMKACGSEYTPTFMRLQKTLYDCLQKNDLLVESPVKEKK